MPRTYLIILIASFYIILTPSAIANNTTKNSPQTISTPKIEKNQTRLQNRLKNQTIHLNNVTITNISEKTLYINHEAKTYTITTNSKTQFRRRFWGKSEQSEMRVGDVVNVIGKWTDDTGTTLLASHIRNLSLQKRYGVFIGKVQSINSSSWVIQTPNLGTQTILFQNNTKVTDRRGQTIKLSDITIGHTIRIRGLWDKQTNTISEVSVVKNYSLPIQPKTSPSPTP